MVIEPEGESALGMTYTIGEVARMSGVSPRALRLYEDEGLLTPARKPNGYRCYTSAEMDRLQEIMLFRRMGVPLGEIAPLLSSSAPERRKLLSHHLAELRRERAELDRLIHTIEVTIKSEAGGTPMTDEEKFDGMKRQLIEENERAYGAEVRARYGDESVDESNRTMMGLTSEQYERFRELELQILEALEAAVAGGADPLGEEGARVYALHRAWLSLTWPQYAPEMHRGLAESYVADDRFRAYYDRAVEGCAQWLCDAVAAHA